MNKKISIITVVKNGMPFLKSAIKSFNLQNYDNKELIIVFAPSKDGTEEYLNNLKSKNIKIFQDKKSTTKFGSLNLGIQFSSGDILGILHSDDIFFDENILSLISNNFKGIDLLYGNILFSNKNDLSKINRVWKSTKFKKFLLELGWMPPHTSVFVRKQYMIENNYYYDEKYPISGDYDFILKTLHNSNIKTLYLNEFISIMRSGGDSTNIKNLFHKFKEDLFISNKYLKLGILSIFFKISQKIFQLKIYNKKIENKYIKDLNNL
tara:strand:- start:4016 stop:4810 length:795 start_codon:yes stop_codon:yes gene_type:complete